ncbi:hypothetical protein GNP94_21890 [Paenibacillus campinasensis]|uniref:Uncharacterized protein n=1 Tax=Paenibacillus campinasensis TaxID=66347 RepID=A0ABW9T6B2_9BACL|nr:hypothetical protein [Paenibacillus campinasensis]MUG68627.1 hypothetical protein [Paenibacillus campinasensis]
MEKNFAPIVMTITLNFEKINYNENSILNLLREKFKWKSVEIDNGVLHFKDAIPIVRCKIMDRIIEISIALIPTYMETLLELINTISVVLEKDYLKFSRIELLGLYDNELHIGKYLNVNLSEVESYDIRFSFDKDQEKYEIRLFSSSDKSENLAVMSNLNPKHCEHDNFVNYIEKYNKIMISIMNEVINPEKNEMNFVSLGLEGGE